MKFIAFTNTAQTKVTYIDYAGQKNTISVILIATISDGNNSFDSSKCKQPSKHSSSIHGANFYKNPIY